jgi:hypothetical protein
VISKIRVSTNVPDERPVSIFRILGVQQIRVGTNFSVKPVVPLFGVFLV